ncbi:FAD/FMN-containing dehydrogenase [Streptacidiphilus sp. MAP12-20]|uniref:FAD-binding oxidoreductase n=1 Tax=Streptacidiphilus sp. MAP12-20 TaxID=3156299 RepID=UPI0035185118
MESDGVSDAALADLGAGFDGALILPEDPGYDDARTVFNAAIDRRPAVIAQCAGPPDIARAIRFGREHGLEIAVRGGGHSVAGMAITEGGIVIDLRRMNSVSVDPAARTARAGGGTTMGDFDRATQPYALACTGGRVSTTGLAGLTLGGGSGWLERTFGLTCDNLLSVTLVTADGSTLRAAEDENPELFWALHGGGGNFGVVTEFTFRLHPVSTITFALLLWEPAAGFDVGRAYRDFMATAPDEVGGGFLFCTAPPEDFVPESLVGHLACGVLLTYVGGEEAAREVFRPMLELGHACAEMAELPYADFQCALDDPPGFRNYWSAEYLDAVPDEVLKRFCERADQMITPSPSQLYLLPQGGAVSRGRADYPVPWRTASWVVHPYGMWSDATDDERGRRWVQETRAELRPWSTGAVYLNFIGHEGQERVVAGFGRANYERLAAVKRQYDPENVFHLNHNVRPQ